MSRATHLRYLSITTEGLQQRVWAYSGLFLRGFCIVGLTAANVAFIAHRNYPLAMLTSYGISVLWWTNSQQAHRSTVPGARWVYAAGAAAGTLVGMALA
jgi:hypothetical protein